MPDDPTAHGDHDHGHEHGHGHEHDKGFKAMLRYLRHAPQMWTSEVNTAVVQRLAPQAGEAVLDIGAGMGAGSAVAIGTGCTLVAVEPTGYMRRIMEVRFFLGRATGLVKVVRGSAEATTVDAESINAAWAVNTMHHWTSLEGGIAELARVLRPGGRLLLVDEDFDDPTHPEYESFGAKRTEEHTHHFQTVEPDIVATAMDAVGLKVKFAGRDQIAGRPAIVIEGTA